PAVRIPDTNSAGSSGPTETSRATKRVVAVHAKQAPKIVQCRAWPAYRTEVREMSRETLTGTSAISGIASVTTVPITNSEPHSMVSAERERPRSTRRRPIKQATPVAAVADAVAISQPLWSATAPAVPLVAKPKARSPIHPSRRWRFRSDTPSMASAGCAVACSSRDPCSRGCGRRRSVDGPGPRGTCDMVGSMAGTEAPHGLDDLSDEERAVLERVVDVLRRLRFGTVLLVVQDGKVVQIEMAEKIRLR